MATRATTVLSICALLAFGSIVHAKGSDGVVTLEGSVRHAIDSGDKVALEFTGKLVFRFFTSTSGDSTRKPVQLGFDVHDLHVEMPMFGNARGPTEDPTLVDFANVAKHSLAASETGEVVTISLFTPTLSFDVNGVLQKVSCKVAQVIPQSVERRLR
jgi:hypothetical protein